MINMSVGWYIGLLLVVAILMYIIGYLCGRADGK